jgi:hypothetical protein
LIAGLSLRGHVVPGTRRSGTVGGGSVSATCTVATGTARHARRGLCWWRQVRWCVPGVGYPYPLVVGGTWAIRLMVRFILNIQLVTAAQAHDNGTTVDSSHPPPLVMFTRCGQGG